MLLLGTGKNLGFHAATACTGDNSKGDHPLYQGLAKGRASLQAIDAVEALSIDPADAGPDHWRNPHNRLLAGKPRGVTAASSIAPGFSVDHTPAPISARVSQAKPDRL